MPKKVIKKETSMLFVWLSLLCLTAYQILMSYLMLKCFDGLYFQRSIPVIFRMVGWCFMALQT